MAALPRQVAHAARGTCDFAEILAGVDAAAITSRDHAGHFAGDTQARAFRPPERGRARGPFGGFSTVGWGLRRRPCRASLPHPDRSTSRRGPRATTGVRRGPWWRGLPRRRPGAQRLQLPHDARCAHHGDRVRTPSGARSFRRRPADRTAVAGDRRTAAGAYRARPASCASWSKRPRRPASTSPALTKGLRAARPCPVACATGSARAASPSTRATRPPTWD